MLSVRVEDIQRVNDSVSLIHLVPSQGECLPLFTAGSHIDVVLPNGISRSYSILNSPAENDRYVLGILRAEDSRGGSKYMHDVLKPGDSIDISLPTNNFPFNEEASFSVLIGGGIGVTPLLSMIHRARALNSNWTLLYCARSRATAPFLSALEEYGDKVRYWFDDENAGMLDIVQVVREFSADVHFYCCGPEGMLNAFEQATAHLPQSQVHLERFSSRYEAATAGGFEVVLAQSGLTLAVTEGRTILEVVTEAGVDVPSSCSNGICGTCETAVLEGIPEHRDEVLTESERAANNKMMICCSGSKSARLVLDI